MASGMLQIATDAHDAYNTERSTALFIIGSSKRKHNKETHKPQEQQGQKPESANNFRAGVDQSINRSVYYYTLCNC